MVFSGIEWHLNGIIKIRGTDLEYGMIPTGSEIVCDYEMSDSGNLSIEVSVPSIGATFNNKNFKLLTPVLRVQERSTFLL